MWELWNAKYRGYLEAKFIWSLYFTENKREAQESELHKDSPSCFVVHLDLDLDHPALNHSCFHLVVFEKILVYPGPLQLFSHKVK